MKARVVASVVLALGVAIGTAGCNLLAPQETTRITQSTSFGVEGDVGNIHIRNAYLVAKGDQVSLIATFVNVGSSSETLSVQPNASTSRTKSVHVGTGAPTVIGPKHRVQWSGVNASPGSLFPIFFTYADKTGVTLRVPVLTGDFGINSTLTPTPASTSTGTPTPAPGATSTSTPSVTPSPATTAG